MFDTWLAKAVRQRFDQALDEPLPEELAALLAETPARRDDH